MEYCLAVPSLMMIIFMVYELIKVLKGEEIENGKGKKIKGIEALIFIFSMICLSLICLAAAIGGASR